MDYSKTKDVREAFNVLRFGIDLLESKDRAIGFWRNNARKLLKENNELKKRLKELEDSKEKILPCKA